MITISIVYTVLLIFSIITALIGNNLSGVSQSVLQSGKQTADFIIEYGSAIIIYSGIMNVANKAGLCDALSKLLKPIFIKLYGPLESNVLRDITMNVSCNFLGLGNAATPYGISAIKAMAKGDTATNQMALFVVMNSSSIQFLPATLASILKSAGSNTPFDILPAVWLSSATALAVGITACKICERFDNSAKRRFAALNTYNRHFGSSKKS